MGVNWTDCQTNQIDMWTVVASLFAEEAGTHYPFRIVQKTFYAGQPIACDTKDSFEELFRRAIEIADDNKPALRVVIVDYPNGVGLDDVPPCVNSEDVEYMARRNFCITTEGDVAVFLANIT